LHEFYLTSLPFAVNALAAKGMCQETLELHHGKHHNTYVVNLNGLVERTLRCRASRSKSW
jgi:Fe-Mn family superoxide dismutase